MTTSWEPTMMKHSYLVEELCLDLALRSVQNGGIVTRALH